MVLQAASAGGNVQSLKPLLDKAADIDAVGKHYASALHVASAEGHE